MMEQIPGVQLFFRLLIAAPTLEVMTINVMLSVSLFGTIVVAMELCKSLAALMGG